MGKLIIASVYGLGLWFAYSLGKRGFGRTIVEIEDTIGNIRKWGRDKLDDLGSDIKEAKKEKSEE